MGANIGAFAFKKVWA